MASLFLRMVLTLSLVLSRKIGSDFEAGSQWMNFVAISDDGKTVASDGALPGGASGTGLWTFPEGRFLHSLDGHPRAMSPDFGYLATENRIVDTRDGRTAFSLASPYQLWTEAAFSPDSRFFAYAAYTDDGHPETPRITIVRSADGSVVRKLGRRHTTALAIHPDNRTLASGHWDNVTLWDLSTGRQAGLLPGFGRYVYGIGFSRDGRRLAAGTDDGQLQIWDVAERKQLHTLRIGWGDVSNPQFSPDGKLVAAGTYADGTVTVVDAGSGAVVSQTKVSMFGCGSVAFSPDGKYLLVPSNGGQLGPKRFDRGGSLRVLLVN